MVRYVSDVRHIILLQADAPLAARSSSTPHSRCNVAGEGVCPSSLPLHLRLLRVLELIGLRNHPNLYLAQTSLGGTRISTSFLHPTPSPSTFWAHCSTFLHCEFSMPVDTSCTWGQDEYSVRLIRTLTLSGPGEDREKGRGTMYVSATYVSRFSLIRCFHARHCSPHALLDTYLSTASSQRSRSRRLRFAEGIRMGGAVALSARPRGGHRRERCTGRR
ncbi:hypothetical protein B0H10DRAFT_505531 [Mycena sp. CBHHK59/15]|nr:hypothetical protein B0H10DRAFT_505531 [Mycena sp. CBHHK59/15]